MKGNKGKKRSGRRSCAAEANLGKLYRGKSNVLGKASMGNGGGGVAALVGGGRDGDLVVDQR